MIYVKKEAASYKNEFLEIVHEVQDLLRQDFTLSIEFIGKETNWGLQELYQRINICSRSYLPGFYRKEHLG